MPWNKSYFSDKEGWNLAFSELPFWKRHLATHPPAAQTANAFPVGASAARLPLLPHQFWLKNTQRAPTRHLSLLYNWQTIFTIMRLVSLPPFVQRLTPLWLESVRGKRFRIQFMGRITWKATLCVSGIWDSPVRSLRKWSNWLKGIWLGISFDPKLSCFLMLCSQDKRILGIALLIMQLLSDFVTKGCTSAKAQIAYLSFIVLTIWLVITVT